MSRSPEHPQIYEYLRRYQQDPTSRIFAPLAEAYRKSGLVDEAIEIAREGLAVHPNFIGGRVALSRALFDKKLYSEVVKELVNVVEDVPDNVVAQRLIAESFLMLGHVPEALSAYKMLLYFSPADPETMKMVQELENQAYENGVLVLRTDPKKKEEPLPEFAEKAAQNAIEDDPALRRARLISKIEKLNGLLQRVERYRALAQRERLA